MVNCATTNLWFSCYLLFLNVYWGNGTPEMLVLNNLDLECFRWVSLWVVKNFITFYGYELLGKFANLRENSWNCFYIKIKRIMGNFKQYKENSQIHLPSLIHEITCLFLCNCTVNCSNETMHVNPCYPT